MGAARAEAAVASLVKQYDLGAILSIGFAGGVVPYLRVGDLIVMSQVHALPQEAEGKPPAMSSGLACDPGLVDAAVAAARQRGLAFHVGSSLTVPEVVSEPQMKERIALRWQVAVVEMESYWIGRVAAERDIPFLAVRAVSDTVSDRLPDLRGVIDGEGNVHTLRALGRLMRYPYQAWGVLCLATGARLASRNLAMFVEAFLTSFPSNQGGRP
jgi:adenosylhomocysteine nucleosidase